MVSEEDLPAYKQRSQWPLYWLVDPIDGTKEFIGRTGEFVINIALMHQHQPVFGMIYQITEGRAWWGGPEVGAYFANPLQKLSSQRGATSQSILRWAPDALGGRASGAPGLKAMAMK